MRDLIIVSNRGPFVFSEDFISEAEACLKEEIRPETPSFGEGGLVQAMVGLLKPGEWNTTWIGASMGDRDIDVARGHYAGLFERMREEKYAPDYFPYVTIEPDTRMHFQYKEFDFYMRFVFFDTEHMHSYYSKFANGFLWPLMHLTRSPLFYKKAKMFPRPRFRKNDFVQYISSGVTFANTILNEIGKGGGRWKKSDKIVVWNQDYHLMRTAEIYKALLLEEGLSEEETKKIHVGQFLHTPFFDIHEIQGLIREDKRNRVKDQVYDPFVETLETTLKKLTWGMLSNDFIGFQTREYCDNYLEALEEWFPVEIKMAGRFYKIIHQDSVTTIGAFPIGLDVDHILSEVSADKGLSWIVDQEDLREKISSDRISGRHIFGGLERCDYTKGLIERLNIFYHAITKLRNLNQDARLYQVTAPSRSDNPDYQDLQTVMEQEIKRLNKKLGGTPIIYVSEGISPPQNYRFLKEVEVMLVTPLEDGMNLVAFEYILSQKSKKPSDRGMLVLSTSGASRILKQQGFGEEDGIVYVNPMRAKNAAEKAIEALRVRRRLSDRLIQYVEREHRVEDWAKKNIEAILNCRNTLLT
jgi:trehalose-6-phosphate synthase